MPQHAPAPLHTWDHELDGSVAQDISPRAARRLLIAILDTYDDADLFTERYNLYDHGAARHIHNGASIRADIVERLGHDPRFNNLARIWAFMVSSCCLYRDREAGTIVIRVYLADLAPAMDRITQFLADIVD